MVQQWQDLDWRAVEDRLNAYDNFVTDVDGQRIHFLHVRSQHAEATPLLLAHTYPGSVLDFVDMIEPLVDPEAHGGRAEDAFHLVIPSMPGFGWSTPVADAGWTAKRVAAAYDVLMRRLGYDAYGVHGSDMGAMVGRELAVTDPEGFRGAHVLQLFSFPSGDPAEFEAFGPKEYAALGHMEWFQSVGGYNAMNASRPQTVAAGLADSPVAVLAYSELFESFGNGTSLVTPEQVLAQATLYWLTNTYALGGALLLRRAALGRGAGRQRRPDRRRGLQGRLPDDPPARRARQHGHRPLVGAAEGRPLRGHGGAAGRRRRPAGLLRLSRPTTPLRGITYTQ